MTGLAKTQLKTILWKEWRQASDLFYLAVAILVGTAMLPFFALPGSGFEALFRRDFVCAGAALATVLTCLGLGVVGYGIEFNDRTAAYLATRPLSHNQVFFTKIGLGLLISMTVAFFAWVLVTVFADTVRTEGTHSVLREWFTHWWAVAPSVYLAVQSTVLLVRPMIPSLIAACTIGLLALYVSFHSPVWVLAPAWFLLGWASYLLARDRMHG